MAYSKHVTPLKSICIPQKGNNTTVVLYLHEVESCHLIDWCVGDDAVLLGVDDGWADETSEQQVGAHRPHLPDV